MVELEEEANLHREENEELRRANDEFAVVNDDLQNRIEEMERLNIQRDDQAESEKLDLNGQLESAQRKIDNYKDKLLEKVDVIRRLELELA
jgi:predicted  nucleic acid-binding Zn-ribbon protein